MQALSRILLSVVVVASTATPALAQSARGRGQRTGGQAAAPGGQSRPSSFERQRAQYIALRQVRDGLQKYLATLDSASAEHQSASRTLQETEAKIAELERGLLDAIASPGQLGAPERAPAPERIAATPPAPGDDSFEAASPAGGGSSSRGASSRSDPPDSGGDSLAAEAAAAAGAQDPAPPAPQGGGAAPAATPSLTFVEWLNNKVEEKSVALINQGSPLNQTETPAGSQASTSLVDQSSASDLIGVGLNLAGLSGSTNDDDDDTDATSASVTASAYSLYSAFRGADPLDPVFYNQHPGWRRLYFTLGFDNEKKEGEETADRATIAGFKFLIINGREVRPREDDPEKCRITNFMTNTTLGRPDANVRARGFSECDDDRLLTEATIAFANLEDEIIASLAALPTVRNTFIAPAYTAFIDELVKRFEDDAQRIRQDLARRKPDSEMTDEALQSEIDKLLGEDAAANDARVKRLRRTLELKAGLELLRRQVDELKKNRGLAAAAVLDPARQSEWTFGEKQFFRVGFKNEVLQSAGGFGGLLAALTPDEREAVDKLIDARINPFVQLNSSTRRALEEIRARPQLSFSFLSKRRQRGDDEYTADLIYERGLGTRTFATLNAGFKYKNSPLLGGDTRGGKVAGQLQFQVTPEESLISKSPIFLYLSGDAEWLSGVKPKYRAQAKVKIPLADGIEIPFSVTYANRTDLIDESDVRGQVGFTFDTARLLRAFKFRLPSVNNRTIDLSTIAPRVTPISGQ